MTSKDKIQRIDLTMASGGASASFGREIFIHDNLGTEKEGHGSGFGVSPCRFMFLLYIGCVEGEISFNVDMRGYKLKKNDLAVIRPGCVFDDFRMFPRSKGIMVAVSPDGEYFSVNSKSTIYLASTLLNPLIISFPDDSAARSLQFYSRLKHILLSEDDEFKGDAVHGMLLLMQSSLAGFLKASKKLDVSSRNGGAGTEIMRKFLVSLGNNYTRERGLQFYASELGITPKYFAQAVFHASGRHAKEWINSYVIMDAKTMLASGKYTVQQVSDALNFANPSFFGKFFKAAVGLSPRSYVKSRR